MNRQYRLPTGKTTSSVTRYLREWSKTTKAVARKLDACVYAYDPGVCVCLPDGSGAVTLPLWVVKKIVGGTP